MHVPEWKVKREAELLHRTAWGWDHGKTCACWACVLALYADVVKHRTAMGESHACESETVADPSV